MRSKLTPTERAMLARAAYPPLPTAPGMSPPTFARATGAPGMIGRLPNGGPSPMASGPPPQASVWNTPAVGQNPFTVPSRLADSYTGPDPRPGLTGPALFNNGYNDVPPVPASGGSHFSPAPQMPTLPPQAAPQAQQMMGRGLLGFAPGEPGFGSQSPVATPFAQRAFGRR